jgi:DNA-binding transcriptional ArsR family regulator
MFSGISVQGFFKAERLVCVEVFFVDRQELYAVLTSYGDSGVLDMAEPDSGSSARYSEMALKSLERAELVYVEKDLVWCTVLAYYAEYYSLNALLKTIGVVCDTLSSAIAVAKAVVGEAAGVVEKHKELGVEARDRMQAGRAGDVRKMMAEARGFVSLMSEVMCSMSAEDISRHRMYFQGVCGAE